MKKVTKVFVIISALILVASLAMFAVKFKGDSLSEIQRILGEVFSHYYDKANKKEFYIMIGSLAIFSAFIGIFMAKSRRRGLTQTKEKLWLILAFQCIVGCLLYPGLKSYLSFDKFSDFSITLPDFKRFEFLSVFLYFIHIIVLLVAAILPANKKEAKRTTYRPLRVRFYVVSFVISVFAIFYMIFSYMGATEPGYILDKAFNYTFSFKEAWTSPHMQGVMFLIFFFMLFLGMLVSLIRRKRNILPVIYLFIGLLVAYELFIFYDLKVITVFLYTNVLDGFATTLTTISVVLLIFAFLLFVVMVGYSLTESLFSLFDKNEYVTTHITKNQVAGIQDLLDSIENPVDEVDETPDEEEETEEVENTVEEETSTEEEEAPEEETTPEEEEEKPVELEDFDDDPDAYDDEEDEEDEEEQDSSSDEEEDELDEEDEEDDTREALKRRRELIRQRILAAKSQSEEEEPHEDEVVVEDEDQVVYEDDEVVSEETEEKPVEEDEDEVSDVYEESVKYDAEDEETEDDEEEEEEDEDDEEESERTPLDVTEASTPARSFVRVKAKPLKEKLLLLDDEKKERYNTIRNELQSYKKVHERLSSKGDSYRFHKDLIAKMSIAGKTVRLHLALNPSDFENSKYAIRDLSDKKRYVYTPLTIRLTSKRSVKHALELIGMLASAFNLEKNPKYQEQDYISQIEIEERTKGE